MCLCVCVGKMKEKDKNMQGEEIQRSFAFKEYRPKYPGNMQMHISRSVNFSPQGDLKKKKKFMPQSPVVSKNKYHNNMNVPHKVLIHVYL